MKTTEMLEKIKNISNDMDIEKIEISFYEKSEENEMFKTTIKIDRDVC